jgi:hypothetical protein
LPIFFDHGYVKRVPPRLHLSFATRTTSRNGSRGKVRVRQTIAVDGCASSITNGDAIAMINLGWLYSKGQAWRRTTLRRASGNEKAANKGETDAVGYFEKLPMYDPLRSAPSDSSGRCEGFHAILRAIALIAQQLGRNIKGLGAYKTPPFRFGAPA